MYASLSIADAFSMAKDLPNGQQLTIDKLDQRQRYQVAVWNHDQTNHWAKEFTDLKEALVEYNKFAS